MVAQPDTTRFANDPANVAVGHHFADPNADDASEYLLVPLGALALGAPR